jgi:arylsulfatase A-like enzyme
MINIMRKLHVIILSLSVLAFHSCKKNVEKSRQWNILWIVADDLGTDLGCYGTPLVKTPNLDQLSREGCRYTSLFTVTAVCSPSRSTLVTGMYPVSINCHQHRTHFKKPLADGIRPITEYFHEAGYFVSNGSVGDRNLPGKQDYNFIADEHMYDGTDWSLRKPGQPFFAQIQISGPHREFHRDPENPVNADSVKLPPYYPDRPLARQDWALYLENIQIVDRQVGEILDRLDREGLSDSTIVFFFGDQGRPHVRAKQFLYDGGIHTPLIIRWPGRVGPGCIDRRLISNVDLPAAALKAAGIELPGYMQGIDFLGQSGPIRDAVFAMRDRRDETVDRIRCIRTNRYKYIRNFYPDRPYTQFNAYKKHQYPVLTLMQVMYRDGELDSVQARFMGPSRPPEELYDLEADPFEIRNLAGRDDYQKVQAGLSGRLDKWLEQYDHGVYPEDPEEVEYWKEFSKKDFQERMARRGLDTAISDDDYLQYWMEYLKPTESKHK